MLGSKGVCKGASLPERTESRPLHAREQHIILKCLRDAHFGLFAKQWHSGGMAGRHQKDLTDPHIRGAGVVVGGVFRLGDRSVAKGSSEAGAPSDRLMFLSTAVVSTVIFHLYVDDDVYTAQVNCKCFRTYMTSLFS